MDQVRQQGDAAAGDEDCELSAGGKREDDQGEADRPKPLPRAFDALIDQPVGVAVAAMVMVVRMWLGLVGVRTLAVTAGWDRQGSAG